jgi:hypothetical protein
MSLRFLNVQGIAGLASSVVLAALLLWQHLDARHWRNESERYEKLFTDEQLALARTTASYREAADKARADDRANAVRVTAEQQAINQRTEDDYEKRLAAARLAADRLRQSAAAGAADPRAGGTAPMSPLSASSGSPAQGAGDHRLPALGTEAALTATEQAIQLDELIRWVKRQSAVDPNPAVGPAPR